MYYINPNTDEVHEKGSCGWQDTIDDWNYLGRFSSLSAAVAYAKRNGYPDATRCEHCAS